MPFVEGKIGKGFLADFTDDPSWVALLASNIFVIALAIIQNWSLVTVMFIYWIQSATIGIFTVLKIIMMRNYDQGAQININGKPVTGNATFAAAKIFMAGFFSIHYGMFHLIYLVFLISFAFIPSSSGPAPGVDVLGVLVSGILFFINHLYSFIYNQKKEINYSNNINDISSTFMAPYARIIPMHLTIIFGFGFAMLFPLSIFPLLLFMVLKTGADLTMHANKHYVGNSGSRI